MKFIFSHIIVTLWKSKDKEINLKAARDFKKKKCMYRETMIGMLVYFSSETMKTRIQWNDILKVLKVNNSQLSYQPKSFNNDWEHKGIFRQKKMKESLVKLFYKKKSEKISTGLRVMTPEIQLYKRE